MKVYKPHFHKGTGRWYVNIVDEVTGKKTSKPYARYLMEQHLGRTLEPWEHVDHINEDKTDDRIENLQVVTQAENNRKYHRLRNSAKWYKFTCPVCGKETRIEYRLYKFNQLDKGMNGPYCSISCSKKAYWMEQHSKDHGPWYEFVCPVCGNKTRRKYAQYKSKQLVSGLGGPYCSRSCSNKARRLKRSQMQGVV